MAPEDPGELTADEERVIGALGSLGVTAAPAEHAGPRGASVQAVLEDGSTVLLTATPAGVEPAGVTVLEQRTVAGVAIAVVEYASAPGRRTQLTCGDLTYELYGLAGADWPVPPGFSGPDAFLGALVDALGC